MSLRKYKFPPFPAFYPQSLHIPLVSDLPGSFQRLAPLLWGPPLSWGMSLSSLPALSVSPSGLLSSTSRGTEPPFLRQNRKPHTNRPFSVPASTPSFWLPSLSRGVHKPCLLPSRSFSFQSTAASLLYDTPLSHKSLELSCHNLLLLGFIATSAWEKTTVVFHHRKVIVMAPPGLTISFWAILHSF